MRGACASGGFGRYARGCFAAARFLHSSAHDALGGCSLFTFFYILHDALGGCSLFFYILLLMCLGGVKVFVILCESERVYACARKILVSVSSLSLPVTFSPLSEIRNSMDSS